MAVEYTATGRSFVARKARPWSPVSLGDTGVISNLDLDLRTGRVVALMPAGGAQNQQSPNHVTVRLNAGEESRRRVLGGRRVTSR